MYDVAIRGGWRANNVNEVRSERVTTLERPAPLGDLVGKRWVSGFKIARLIGVGGMGEVWAATSDELPGQQLAVKVISPEYAHDRSTLERFFGEARAASALDDPNVIKIFDTGRLDDKRPALIMEYIDGPSLQALCEQSGPLAIEVIGQILIQVASALRSAHAKNITHRDIKPSNILVTSKWGRQQFVVVVDFGIAKLHDPQLAGKIRTRTKTFIGTPGFAAPEQALGKPVDNKADIYALGVVAFYALTRRLPYEGDSELGMLNLQASGAPFPAPITLRPDVPPVWNDLIVACLHVDRTRRPSAVEFAQQVAAGLPNGTSLLATLAPTIAVQRPFAVAARTLSSDVPTALSQLGIVHAMEPPSRASLRGRGSLLAGALGGLLVGCIATAVAIHAVSPASESTGAPTLATSGVSPIASTADAGISLSAPSVDAASLIDAAPPEVPLAEQVAARPAAATPPAIVPVDATRLAVDAGVPVDAPVPPTDAGAPATVAPKPARVMGRIVIHVAPFAEVYIDGNWAGTTPVNKLLPAGPHRVRLVNQTRGRDEPLSVTIDPKKTVTIDRTW